MLNKPASVSIFVPFSSLSCIACSGRGVDC